MDAKTKDIAELFFRIVPQVMRVVSADVRRSAIAIDPLYIHHLGLLKARRRSLGEMAELLAVSAPTMSKTVNNLEAKGWVERERSEEDRRMVNIVLTGKGEEVLAEARAHIASTLAEALETVTEEEQERLRAGLLALGEAYAHAFPDDEMLGDWP